MPGGKSVLPQAQPSGILTSTETQVRLTVLLKMSPLPTHDSQSIHLMQPVLAIRFSTVLVLLLFSVTQSLAADESVQPVPLAGTQPLTSGGDIASELVTAADLFLRRQLEQSKSLRARNWHRDLSSPAAYQNSIEPEPPKTSSNTRHHQQAQPVLCAKSASHNRTICPGRSRRWL